MFDILFAHIQEKIELTNQEKELIKTFFKQKKLRKRQYLLQEGDICKQLSFVSRGVVKSYTLDEKGNEHISVFGWEGWWISDFQSFICGHESILNIDAIEETELLLISRGDYEKMMLRVPIMERYFRILYQNSLVTKEQRLIYSHTYTAEEKYRQLIKEQPLIFERIPQNLIASYLGLTSETISRIKKKLLL